MYNIRWFIALPAVGNGRQIGGIRLDEEAVRGDDTGRLMHIGRLRISDNAREAQIEPKGDGSPRLLRIPGEAMQNAGQS